MFSTIDTHVAGEAFRIVIHSSIILSEKDIQSNHTLLKNTFYHEKALLLNEPRGHRGMNGCIIIPSKVADYGLLFFNHDSEIAFQYGGLVASITALLETGNLTKRENSSYRIETINGIFQVEVKMDNQEVISVQLESKHCQVVKDELDYNLVEVDESRDYLVFDLPDSVPEISLKHLSIINKWGREATKRFADRNIPFEGIIIAQSIGGSNHEVRSVTFTRDSSILRSPGMDSTFAIFTALLDRGDHLGNLTNRSIFDSVLSASLIPGTNNHFSIETQGFTTGMHQFIYDQTDPLKNGFLLK